MTCQCPGFKQHAFDGRSRRISLKKTTVFPLTIETKPLPNPTATGHSAGQYSGAVTKDYFFFSGGNFLNIFFKPFWMSFAFFCGSLLESGRSNTCLLRGQRSEESMGKFIREQNKDRTFREEDAINRASITSGGSILGSACFTSARS